MLRDSICLLLVTLFGTQVALTTVAGEFNEVLSYGDKAPMWNKLPGADGKQHSLSDLTDKEVVVVAFTCLSCPTAVDYEERIQALAKKHAAEGKVAVVAVCVNRIPADHPDRIAARWKAKDFAFSYLSDESQKIAKDFGAIFTPEFYVLDKDRRVVYMGSLDDATDPNKVQKKFVEEAIDAALNGAKPAVTETLARGCRVRYVRDRKPAGQ